MAERTTPERRLAALGAHLGARGLAVDLTAQGLRVADAHAADTITCRARRADAGRLWFWTSEGEPIAEADRIIDASMVILGNLARQARQ